MSVRFHGDVDAVGISSAVKLSGLTKSRVLVVGDAAAGQRRQYRVLDFDVPRASRRRRLRPYSGHAGHASAQRGLFIRLRLPLVVAARGRAADLSVRYLAIERCRGPFGGDGGRDLSRGAMDDDPLATGDDVGR